MPNSPSESDILRVALGPGEECPPLDRLARYAEGARSGEPGMAQHLQSCTYCQTELHLLRSFQAGGNSENSDDVRRVTESLNDMRLPVAANPARTGSRERWWISIFSMPRLAPAAFAMAAVLLVAASVLYIRQSRKPVVGALNPGAQQEVLRSPGFAVLSPAGDLQERPDEIRWEAVPQAARYQVRLLQVDGSELWKTETSNNNIAIPAAVRSQIVPAKTLFSEIKAFNSSGAKIAETGSVRFRLVNKTSAR